MICRLTHRLYDRHVCLYVVGRFAHMAVEFIFGSRTYTTGRVDSALSARRFLMIFGDDAVVPYPQRRVQTVSVSHIIFSLLKLWFVSHKSLRMGIQPKHKHLNETQLFLCLLEQLTLQCRTVYESCRIRSVHSSVTRGQFCTYSLWLTWLKAPTN